MKKVISLFLVLLISIPFFSISASATSFDLGSPNKLSYIDNTSRTPQTFRYFNSYRLYYSDDELVYTGGSSGFDWFAYRLNPNGVPQTLWELGTSNLYPDASIFSPSVASSPSYLWVRDGYNRSNDLTFASFVYEGLILPVTGQYLKVTISFYSFLETIPSYYNYLLDSSNFCYLCDDSTGGTGDLYSLPRLSPSSVSITNKGNSFYEYSFYFNYNGIDPELFLSDNICLAVRVPFYFAENSKYNNGVQVYSQASLPTSYEILTVGGYNDELNSIENSITVGFDELNATLIDQLPTDVTAIASFADSNVELDNTVDDYLDVNDRIENIDSSITLPDLNDNFSENVMADLQLPDFGNLTLLWNDLITEMLVLVFSLGVAGVILFGKRS